MTPAIRVDNLGKQYRVAQGRPLSGYRTLRESLVEAAAAPLRRLRGAAARAEAAESESFWALRDVSFEVQPGEVLGIVGRNGAGKSTLLKILSRITKPTTGRVEINGRVGSLLEVGTGFHPELTGRENVYLNGSILGMSAKEIDRRFEEIVAFAEVERFLDVPVKRYSSGMYVRLAFAVAAHLEPEVLVVDEVLAVGDAAFQKKCLGRMSEVSHSGKTVLFVSHQMASVTNLCQRGIWLDAGRIVEAGTATHVVDRYLSAHTWCKTQIVDLATVPRKGSYTQSVRLDRLEWLTDLPLKHNQECRIRIRYTTLGDTEEAAFGIGFSTIEGARFLSFDTDYQNNRRRLRAGSSGHAELTIPALPIAPGFYTVDVGVRSGDRHVIDLVQSAIQIEILPSVTTPSYIAQYPGVGVRLGGDWDWSDH